MSLLGDTLSSTDSLSDYDANIDSAANIANIALVYEDGNDNRRNNSDDEGPVIDDDFAPLYNPVDRGNEFAAAGGMRGFILATRSALQRYLGTSAVWSELNKIVRDRVRSRMYTTISSSLNKTVPARQGLDSRFFVKSGHVKETIVDMTKKTVCEKINDKVHGSTSNITSLSQGPTKPSPPNMANSTITSCKH